MKDINENQKIAMNMSICFAILAALTYLEPSFFTFVGWGLGIFGVGVYLFGMLATFLVYLVLFLATDTNKIKAIKLPKFRAYTFIIDIPITLFMWYSIWLNVNQTLGVIGVTLGIVSTSSLLFFRMVYNDVLKRHEEQESNS